MLALGEAEVVVDRLAFLASLEVIGYDDTVFGRHPCVHDCIHFEWIATESMQWIYEHENTVNWEIYYQVDGWYERGACTTTNGSLTIEWPELKDWGRLNDLLLEWNHILLDMQNTVCEIESW